MVYFDELLSNLANVAAPIAITTAVVATIVYLFTRRLMKEYVEDRERSRYNDLKNEAVLSEMRASFEHELSQISRKMVATQARWEDSNHLLISGQNNQNDLASNKAIDVSRFLNPYGIDPNTIKTLDDKVFVLTPFSDEEKSVYEVIKSVCSEAGFGVSRGDEKRAEGDILPQILEGIVSSQIVIANISSRNPNVFFELGIAMALGKSTLLVSDTLSEVPFDLQSRRIIVFKQPTDLKPALTNALLQTLRSTKQ